MKYIIYITLLINYIYIISSIKVDKTYSKNSDDVKIYPSTISIKNSNVDNGNLLPGYLFLQGDDEGGSTQVPLGGGKGEQKPFKPADTCDVDIFNNAMPDLRAKQLPYLTQDIWGCERKEEDINVWIYENQNLKLTITPQYGGKVWSLYDKKREREWFFNNPAHQPANIGSLKAWVSGGCEWNWSPGVIGHSAFTESPVWMGLLETEKGEMLRVYEYDRYNGSVWQVDMLLDGDGHFWAHPKITNPNPKEIQGYWWTCVAVRATPATRIIAPATTVAETSRDRMRLAGWPKFATSVENSSFTGYDNAWGTDNSILGNILWGDFFLRIPDSERPFIASTEEDGFVMVHGHPLNGTKFFTWGQSGGGRFMQDFLSANNENTNNADRSGDYCELQTGPAPTQMQYFLMDADSTLEWSEWFGGFDGNVNALRNNNYNLALDEVKTWMNSKELGGIPTSIENEMDEFFQKYSDKQVDIILSQGMPWGALEELRTGKKYAEGTTFLLPNLDSNSLDSQEVKPWVELIQNGTFLEDSLKYTPLSYLISDDWMNEITKSAEKFGYTWLHYLHLGVGMVERGLVDEPIIYFEKSMSLRPSSVASRSLAVLSNNVNDAWKLFQQSWNILNNKEINDPSYIRLSRNLAKEICTFLRSYELYNELEQFIDLLPSHCLDIDEVLAGQIAVALNNKKPRDAIDILNQNCFPTFAKARVDLISFWENAHEMIEAQKLGRDLTGVEAHQVRINNPQPMNIGCPYESLFCQNYWN